MGWESGDMGTSVSMSEGEIPNCSEAPEIRFTNSKKKVRLSECACVCVCESVYVLREK